MTDPVKTMGSPGPEGPGTDTLNCTLSSRTPNLVDAPHLLPERNWERGIEEEAPDGKIVVKIAGHDQPVQNSTENSFEHSLNEVTKAGIPVFLSHLIFSLQTFTSPFESVISKSCPRWEGEQQYELNEFDDS